MRKHHVFAIVAVLVVGLAVKEYFYPPVAAEADIPAAEAMDVHQMHLDHPNPPDQKMQDMTFVFDSE
jgi:hypothetical protein